MQFQFRDMVVNAGIDPKDVLLLRHTPQESKLKKVLPWLADEKPDLFNAYQQTQKPGAEKAMSKAKSLSE